MNAVVEKIICDIVSLNELDRAVLLREIRSMLGKHISDAEVINRATKLDMADTIRLFKLLSLKMTIPQQVDALMDN